MPPWSKYPSIAESSSKFAGPVAGEWICTEKVHGANFSITVSANGEVAFASRSGILAPNDNFFGYKTRRLDTWLQPRVVELRERLVHDRLATTEATMTIFGELFGGHYPHPDVPAVCDSGRVQNGIWYSPTLCFMGFDIAVRREADGAPQFLSFDDSREAAIAAGLCYATPLCRGTFPQCLDFDIRFSSRLPAALGLPPLPPAAGPNWAEGVVVRPACEPKTGGCRGLIKRKIPEFSERQYAYDDWKTARSGSGGGGVSWTDAEYELEVEVEANITENRLNNVLSKVGHVDVTDDVACRTVLQMLIRDVQDTLVEYGYLADAGELAVRHAPLQRQLEEGSKALVTRALVRRATTEQREELARRRRQKRQGPSISNGIERSLTPRDIADSNSQRNSDMNDFLVAHRCAQAIIQRALTELLAQSSNLHALR